MCLKANVVGCSFRPSSRVFHILMADGIHALDEILVRVTGVNKLFLFLRGCSKISLTNGEINQQYMMKLFHY